MDSDWNDLRVELPDEAQRRLDEKRRERLDQALAKGLADVEAGRVKPAKDVFERLIAKYQKMADERAK